MYRTIIALTFTCLFLLACSPSAPTPKIAEEQREVLKNAEEAAANLEQTINKAKQDIDEQTN